MSNADLIAEARAVIDEQRLRNLVVRADLLAGLADALEAAERIALVNYGLHRSAEADLAAALAENERLRAGIERVRKLAVGWSESLRWDGSPAEVDQAFGRTLLDALDGGSDDRG